MGIVRYRLAALWTKLAGISAKEINEILKSIKPEVIAFSGTVEVIESKKGNFSFKSMCENIHLQEKMNELISHSMSKLRNDYQASGT